MSELMADSWRSGRLGGVRRYDRPAPLTLWFVKSELAQKRANGEVVGIR